jgi:hypothetical protein
MSWPADQTWPSLSLFVHSSHKRQQQREESQVTAKMTCAFVFRTSCLPLATSTAAQPHARTRSTSGRASGVSAITACPRSQHRAGGPSSGHPLDRWQCVSLLFPAGPCPSQPNLMYPGWPVQAGSPPLHAWNVRGRSRKSLGLRTVCYCYPIRSHPRQTVGLCRLETT